MSARILVVDDDRAVRTVLRINLEKRGYDVTVVEHTTAAMQALRSRPFDAVLTDVKMPGATGLQLLERVRRTWPDVQVVVMTGYGSVEDAVAAMKAGAADYLIKPIARDELYMIIDRALENRTLRAELVQLRQEVKDRYGFHNLVGATPAMVNLYEDVAAVADSNATVLLQGPTGTGKELLAHALHYRSSRAKGPFIRVNCTAIPEHLLESELFGHEKGSFTGAIRQHLGKFEQADGGTIFLDEIGEIDQNMQAKLLRVLENGEFARVGSQSNQQVNVRVVAATNRDLREEVGAKRFRADLFYRLNVVTLSVPPLSQRLGDVPLLVEHFVRKYATSEEREVPAVHSDTMTKLQAYSWPGNVRQLEHCVERAVVLYREGDSLLIELPTDADVAMNPSPDARMAVLPDPDVGLVPALESYERAMIIAALKASAGVQAQAARRLDVSKSTLHNRIKRLGIELKDIVYE